MKSPVPITCQCGHHFSVEAIGAEPLKDTECPKCLMPIWLPQGLADFVSIRIMNRAYAELENKDFTLAIVLSAMAVEAELARQYIKWRGIDFGLTAVHEPLNAKDEEWAEEWRGFQTVKKRLDKVSLLLTNQTFDSFIVNNDDLSKAIEISHPEFKNCVSARDFFWQELFDKRNRILHRSKIDFQEQDGKTCFALAKSMFHAKTVMDKYRYNLTWPPKP